MTIFIARNLPELGVRPPSSVSVASSGMGDLGRLKRSPPANRRRPAVARVALAAAALFGAAACGGASTPPETPAGAEDTPVVEIAAPPTAKVAGPGEESEDPT